MGEASSAAADRDDAASQLTAELRQPLTAASNYIGTARVILSSGRVEDSAMVIRKLDKASEQILRAGQILNRLRGQLCDESAAD